MSAFKLDARLAGDSFLLAEGPLSQLRLIDDARFAWLVLVPRVPGAVELPDLPLDLQSMLMAEMNAAAQALRSSVACEKLNLAALGNVVRQLHVHLVARNSTDAAWPGPVWGFGQMERMWPAIRTQRSTAIRQQLAKDFWQLEP